MKKLLLALCALVALALVKFEAHASPTVYKTQQDSIYNITGASYGIKFIDSVIVDTCAVGVADSSRIFDGRGYDKMEVEVFCWNVVDTCGNPWSRIGLTLVNDLLGNPRVRRVADSLATSINIDEPFYNNSGRGTLSGDSLTYQNVPVGSPNMIQSRARPGETQLTLGMQRLWNNAQWTGRLGGSVFIRRNGPLRFFKLVLRPMAQSCYHSAHPAARYYVRVYLYKTADRVR